jgi:energy-coupling factor transporter ATP-binding protein EcfA2
MCGDNNAQSFYVELFYIDPKFKKMTSTKYNTSAVFTPTTPAINTFVEREPKINNHLVDALKTPGKQIILYGHTGCGKTTFLTNKLNQIYENTITTRCMQGMTFENILLDGFDQLGKFYSEVSHTKGIKINPSLTVTYKEIKATLSLGEYSTQKQINNRTILPPQLTPQRLGKFFGEKNACWILEDFHKIKGVEKTRISQLMKVFMDMSVDYPDLKLIALGAVNTARQVVEYDREMNNRVAEIYIPYMSESEIESIINSGEKLLNLKFAKEVKLKIVKYSCGLPSICHQLCLNICFDKRIYQTANTKVAINAPELDEAIEKLVEGKSDTLKADYDKAVKVSNNSRYNIPKEILKAALIINKDEFTFDDIFLHIKDFKVKAEDAEKYLFELCSIERAEILVYDDNSNLYHFNNLFLKAYTLLRFQENKEERIIPTTRDQKVVARLLEIIERDISDEDDDFFIDDATFSES